MRKSTGILLASALVLSLAACATPSAPTLDGGSPVDPASCQPVWQRGGLAADVVPTGDFGQTPVSATFPTPLVSLETTSSSIAIEGDGPVIGPDDIVAGTVTLIDGASGQVLDATSSAIYIPLAGRSPLLDGAVCATVGSRVVAVGSSTAMLGADVVAGNNLDPNGTIVTVLDIENAFISRAQGSTPAPQNGLPTVSYMANGRPGLSFTNANAPTDLRVETLIAGNGSTVQDGDTVLVNYTGVIWDSHKVFDSSWDRGRPEQFATSDVVPGFAKAMIGQRVGSQVLVAIPPSEGYGSQPPANSGISADDTLVFVIDILGVTPPAAG